MNNSNLLSQINTQLNTTAKQLENVVEPKKKQWWQILLNVFLGIITIPIGHR